MNICKPGTTRYGTNFDSTTILRVWEKAAYAPGYSPAVRRLDACGAWIDWAQYGDATPRGTGWEVDHIVPVAKGGTDDLSNLQPLQWENNRRKGDDYPHWTCAVKAA